MEDCVLAQDQHFAAFCKRLPGDASDAIAPVRTAGATKCIKLCGKMDWPCSFAAYDINAVMCYRWGHVGCLDYRRNIAMAVCQQ